MSEGEIRGLDKGKGDGERWGESCTDGELRVGRELDRMTYLYNSGGFPPRFLTTPQGLLCIIIDYIASKFILCNLPQIGCIILTLYTATLPAIYRAVLPRYCGPCFPCYSGYLLYISAIYILLRFSKTIKVL